MLSFFLFFFLKKKMRGRVREGANKMGFWAIFIIISFSIIFTSISDKNSYATVPKMRPANSIFVAINVYISMLWIGSKEKKKKTLAFFGQSGEEKNKIRNQNENEQDDEDEEEVYKSVAGAEMLCARVGTQSGLARFSSSSSSVSSFSHFWWQLTNLCESCTLQ